MLTRHEDVIVVMLTCAEISFAITYHVVNGRLDLVNLFPVKLDFKPFIDAWGNAVQFQIYAPNGSFNFCGVDVSPSAVNTIQTEAVYTIGGDPLYAANLTEVEYEGVDITPSAANGLSDSELQQTPFFLGFVNPEMCTSTNGALVATNYLYRAEMLAYAIPAESYAVGANALAGILNFNMATSYIYGKEDLPTNGDASNEKHQDWQHDTFVQRSFKRTKQLYREIITIIHGGSE